MTHSPRRSRKLDALQIRDAALALMRRHGRWRQHAYKTGNEFVPSFDAKLEGMTISLRTPFSAPTPGPSHEIRYVAALLGKELIEHGYGLDIWAPRKVMNLEWSQPNDILIVSFRRGAWEQKIIDAAASSELQSA